VRGLTIRVLLLSLLVANVAEMLAAQEIVDRIAA